MSFQLGNSPDDLRRRWPPRYTAFRLVGLQKLLAWGLEVVICKGSSSIVVVLVVLVVVVVVVVLVVLVYC